MAKLSTLKPKLKSDNTLPSCLKNSAQSPKNWGKSRGGRPWRRLKDEILARDNYTCQCCGRVGGKLELDHIINLAQGGTDDKDNLQILCHACHKQKTQDESQHAYAFMPRWLSPIYNAVLVFGCAGSGKSTWAKQHGKGYVIVDLDEIIAKQTNKPIYIKNKQDFIQGVRLRNSLLMQLSKNNTPCIIILTGETKSQRQWWIDKIRPSKVVVMDTPPNECIRRILQDKKRPTDIKHAQIQSVHTWWGASHNF